MSFAYSNKRCVCSVVRFPGRRSCCRVARVARVVRASGSAGQECVRHTRGPELRGRRGLGHQLHRGLRVTIRAGRRQAWQQPDTALGWRRGGKCILIIIITRAPSPPRAYTRCVLVAAGAAACYRRALLRT